MALKLLLLGIVIPVVMANLGLFIIEEYLSKSKHQLLIALVYSTVITAALIGGMFLAAGDIRVRIEEPLRPVPAEEPYKTVESR